MFTLRQIVNNTRSIAPNVRWLSKSGSLIDVSVDDERIAVLTMQRSPVNAINLELYQELNNCLDIVAKNKYKGMILTSAFPRVFSAGVDLNEFYKPDRKRLEKFWSHLQDVLIKLSNCEYPTAVAINGHTAAAGCGLSATMEYRVMVDGKGIGIGLNDTMVGIVPPTWLINLMKHTMGNRQAELAVTSSKIYSPTEAMQVSLIDELATDKEDAIEKCKKFIRRFDNIPTLARTITKQRMKQTPIECLLEKRQEDTENIILKIMNPQTQQILGAYVEMLKKKKSTKNS